jgi:hypothetical protein
MKDLHKKGDKILKENINDSDGSESCPSEDDLEKEAFTKIIPKDYYHSYAQIKAKIKTRNNNIRSLTKEKTNISQIPTEYFSPVNASKVK